MTTLGIDTSNYTTSLALSDERGNIICDLRKLLKVSDGQIGLRQSDAFYQHITNLQEMIPILKEHSRSIDTIVVSERPRNLIDSYMPVFNAGVFFSHALTVNNDVTLIKLSHQEGHILSGFMPELLNEDVFYVLHISGGTTELLKVSWMDYRLVAEILFNTLDISMGQLIDRIGVHMGYGFPAGKHLDQMADTYKPTHFKHSYNSKGFNISGIENKLKAMYNLNENPSEIANWLFSYLVELIEVMMKKYLPEGKLLLVGGVAESEFLRAHLQNKVIFAPKGLSSDNAVGLAKYPSILEGL
jgi:N6-L-threonylcarbamoyladenine synthase